MSGKVFENTSPIDHTNIPAILKQLNSLLTIEAIPVGSSATPVIGKQSGDIDVIVDESTILDQFKVRDAKLGRKELYNYIVSKGFNAAQSGVIVHIQFPFNDLFHQIDVMVVSAAKQIAKLHTHNIPKSSKYKGVNKHLLLNLIAKEAGYFWSPWQGLFTRIDNKKGKFVSNDVTVIANLLLSASEDALGSVELILKALPKQKATELLAIAKQDPNWVEKVKPLGRTFNHLEDLVFLYGSEGAQEAIDHLKDFNDVDGARTIRLKWDGAPQIYWGRETVNGPLIFVNHNGWSRKIKCKSAQEISKFIAHNSGTPSAARNKFAKEFSDLYPIFDAATPKDFVGFVYADAIYTQPPSWFMMRYNEYRFSPNPNSNTTYIINENSQLNDRVSNSTAMVAAHAYYSVFGQDENEQDPLADFSQFNNTKELIVQNPIYNTVPITIADVYILEDKLKEYANAIDKFVHSNISGLSDLKQIIYTYFNQSAKQQELTTICVDHFFKWLTTSKVSATKQSKIHTLHFLVPDGLRATLAVTKRIMSFKDRIIRTLEARYESHIRVENGEGYVRYADSTKKFGHIKLVPRYKWIPK
jgi:hypothetical protein